MARKLSSPHFWMLLFPLLFGCGSKTTFKPVAYPPLVQNQNQGGATGGGVILHGGAPGTPTPSPSPAGLPSPSVSPSPSLSPSPSITPLRLPSPVELKSSALKLQFTEDSSTPRTPGVIRFRLDDNGDPSRPNQRMILSEGEATISPKEQFLQFVGKLSPKPLSSQVKAENNGVAWMILKRIGSEESRTEASSETPASGSIGRYSVSRGVQAEHTIQVLTIQWMSYPQAGETAESAKTRLDLFFIEMDSKEPAIRSDLETLTGDFKRIQEELNELEGKPYASLNLPRPGPNPDCWRVLIYRAQERDGFNKAKAAFRKKHPKVEMVPFYQEPDYCIQVGNFKDLDSAEKFLLTLENKGENYGTAMSIVPGHQEK